MVTGELVNQRIEPPQPHLLGQTLTLFNYFWSIGFSWLRATIMSPKVCGVVSAHKSIRAGEIDGFDVQADPALAKPSKISMFNIFLKMQFDAFEFDIMFVDTTDWKE